MAEPGRGPELVIARGARATEAVLLRAIAAHTRAVRADPSRLAAPLRVIVPSLTLREHVIQRIVESCDGAAAGVVVQTLHGFACEILERIGERGGSGDELFPVLVKRVAAREPALRDALDRLDDGYASAIGAVADFLDAGLSSAEAAEDCLTAVSAATGPEIARAVALVRSAVRVQRELPALGVGHRSLRLIAARDALRAAGGALVPASGVLFHGFADATGVALDLIEATGRELGGRLLLDRPLDLVEAVGEGGEAGLGAVSGDDAIVRFTASLAERVAGFAHVSNASASDLTASDAPAPDARELDPSRPDHLTLLSAPGPSAEVRAVAERVRRLLDAGVPAERIGIVARHLAPYAIAVRLHLGRLGIPFSSSAAGPAGPDLRRARAWLDVLRLGGDVSIDRWLDANALPLALRADLRVACHALAAARLADVSELDVLAALAGGDSYPLPVRRGIDRPEAAADDDSEGEQDSPSDDEPEESGQGSGGAVARALALRRHVSRADLVSLVESARACLELLPAAERALPLAEHFERVRAWIALLGASSPFSDVVDRAAQTLPMDFQATRAEVATVLERRLDAELAEPLGGKGGGVRVLDAMAARGCTFDHLFVLGLSRNVFPRVVRADPLLPDALRTALRSGPLDAFPVKERGYDEERYLFVQLLSAAPHVTLAWPRASDDGQERAPSPLVEQVRLANRALPIEDAPDLWIMRAGNGGEAAPPRTGHEHAVVAGVHEQHAIFAAAYPVAVEEALREHAPVGLRGDAGALAAARLATRAELDDTARPGIPIGPYFGFVGAALEPNDPRRDEAWVTTLEGVARCPWQTFLERVLRVEPVPDALGALPGLGQRIIGHTVHLALEEIARRSGSAVGVALGDVLHEPGAPLRWPEEPELTEVLRAAARDALREERLALAGFEPALIALARPPLVLAHDASRDAGAIVLGAEIEGTCDVRVGDGRARRLHFRADRVERVAGELVLTDFKTGKPLSDALKPGTQTAHHLRDLLRGQKLQATAYARGAAARSGGSAVGCYVHVHPKDATAVTFAVRADDVVFAAALDEASDTLFGALDTGAFFPRLEQDGKEPSSCGYCRVSEACLRGDSGARHRLVEWVAEHAGEAHGAGGGRERMSAAERAAVAAWQLAGRKP